MRQRIHRRWTSTRSVRSPPKSAQSAESLDTVHQRADGAIPRARAAHSERAASLARARTPRARASEEAPLRVLPPQLLRPRSSRALALALIARSIAWPSAERRQKRRRTNSSRKSIPNTKLVTRGVRKRNLRRYVTTQLDWYKDLGASQYKSMTSLPIV